MRNMAASFDELNEETGGINLSPKEEMVRENLGCVEGVDRDPSLHLQI